jgi:PAS domain S-box-containing protein
MLNGKPCQEVKPQTIEATSNFLVDSIGPGNKECLHILHVDDDLCFLEVSKQILMLENSFEIDVASSVTEAFKKLESQTYNAIVSDYEMPIKNGLDFLKELRDLQSDIPFILFTGKGREDVAVKALNLGADRFINKNGSTKTVYCELADAIKKTIERKKSKQLLVASESKYRKLVENSLQGIIVTKVAPLKFVFVNNAMGKILGYSPQELMSFSQEEIMNLIYFEDKAVFLNRLEKRFRGEPADSCLEFRVVRKDGSIIWVSAFSNQVDYDGQIAVQAMFLDVTESKKTGDIMLESEKRYRELADSLPNIVFETDLTGRIVFANKIAWEIGGYSQVELEKGLNFAHFLAPEHREMAVREFQKLLSGGDRIIVEFTFVQKNGGTFPALITATSITYQNKVIGVRGLIIDITERKKAEEAIRLSGEKYRSLFENASDVILTGDLSGKITSINGAIEKFGLLREHVVRRNVREFLTIKDGKRQDEIFQEVGSGKSRFGELEATVAIGKRTFEVKTDPLKIGDRVVGFQTILRDATERKEAEEKLRESEEKYRDIFENARDAIYVHDLKGKIFSINKVVEEYGLTQDQIIGKNMLNFVPKKYWPKLFANLSQLAQGKQVEGQIEINTPVGKRSAEYRSNPVIRGSKVIGVHSILRDITERKKTEDALMESQQKYKAMFSSNPEAVVFLDTNFRVVEANSRFSTLFGYSFCEIKGKIITDLIVPDDAKEESRSVRHEIVLGPVEIVAFRKRKDGSQFPLFLSGGPVVVDGKTIGCIVVFKDISNIVTAQEELGNALAKAEVLNEKLNVVGGFTRHDVRNKLSVINGNLYLAEKYAGDNPPLQKCLDQIKIAVSNTARLLEFAKDYEMLGSQERVTLDVGKAVDTATSLFADLKAVKIVNECRGYNVLADSMLSTIFHNLIDNSLKYGQKLTQIKVYIRQNQNELESIVYEDDGVGIDAERKKQLFTRGFGRGTGLGLYLIKRTCEIYGWTVEERGEPGKGAKFEFTLTKNNTQNERSNKNVIPEKNRG